MKPPFDVTPIGKAIIAALAEQGIPPCAYVVVVEYAADERCIGTNIANPDHSLRLMVEAVMAMDMSHHRENEIVGHA